LLGSFLWHDVARIEDQERVEIIESEISLLKQIETSMICLEPMAMPGVLEQTNAITVPWMTLTQIDVSLNDLKRIHILFTGGGTGLINDKLAAVALELAAQNPNWSIYLDAKLFNLTRKSNNGQLNKFNFSQEEFALLDAIVCRPGVGILTDCAQYRIPVLAIGDEENQEIKHNTARVQEMGVGIGIDLIQQHPRITAETVMTLVNSKESLNKFRNQWRKQATGGAEVAALEILSYMSRT
jgi:UDP-N-acetylglucosamine:LPS N-acetylglucosamine transferase